MRRSTPALKSGYAELKAGKSSPDAVAMALVVLEDDPNFNAGKGSVFTHDGRNELDVAIDGRGYFAVTFDAAINGLVCREGHFPDIVHEGDR